MKIVIYALGKIFDRYFEKINWKDIVALCDKSTVSARYFHEKSDIPIVLPDKLSEFDYDFIVIFSNTFFEEIKRELVGEYYIPEDRIISWKEIVENEFEMMDYVLSFCRSYFKRKKYKRYLDIGMSNLSTRYLTKEGLMLGEDIILDGIQSENIGFNVNLYDHVYEDRSVLEDYYDIAFFGDESQCTENMLHSVCSHAKYIVFGRNRLSGIDLKAIKGRLEKYGDVKFISTVDGDLWVIDTECKSVLNNASIYVVIHKKYNLCTRIPYIPLCVGSYREQEYLTEQTGENIAYLNKKINECTALYWIWKNTDSRYVGLNHYRRYFFNNEIESMDNYLNDEHINDIFEEYDIILPKTSPLNKMTVFQQIQSSMDLDLCKKGYMMIRQKLEKKQPEYLEAFDSVMNGYVIFNCNIFVTKREILNQYCEWLFSFLIEAAEEIDVEGYDSYSQRVIGFFAERMWTVWLRKNKVRIKELPYVIIK